MGQNAAIDQSEMYLSSFSQYTQAIFILYSIPWSI